MPDGQPLAADPAPEAPVPECPADDDPFDGDPFAGSPYADDPDDGYGPSPGDRDAAIGTWPDPDPGSGGHRGDHRDRDRDEDPGTGLAPVPMPAIINLLVDAGTLLGWDTTPSQASGWGLLNPDETRDIVQAASRHPQTRWCVTVTGPDGTAAAHGCSPGRHPWSPPPGPTHHRQAAQLADLLRGLNVAIEPIARGTQDDRHAEDQYKPSRKLQHLVRARTATCTAPGCRAEAIHADLDHTIPYPHGPTDEGNLGPKCRSDHRAKQAPGWKVEQPEPGVFRWTLPSGRIHVTRPTNYR
jgi:hypothetical protein